MKRTIAVLLTCLLTASLVSGCGSSQKNNSSSNASAASAVSGDSAASSESAGSSDTSASSGSSAASDSHVSSEPQNSSEKSDTSRSTENTSGNTESASPDSSQTQTSSETSAETSQPGISIDENGNITIDPNQLDISDFEEDSDEDSQDTENSEDHENGENTGFVDLSYQMTYLSPEGFANDSALPAAYYITSPAEFSDFLENNSKAYSLNVAYTDNANVDKISFADKTKDMDEGYFSMNDALIVVSVYSRSDDCDLGSVTIKDNTALVEVWTQEPASAQDKGYVCFVVNMEKGILKDKNITTVMNTTYLDEDGEEDE